MRDGNLFAEQCPSRDVLKHVTSRWGVLILVALREGTTVGIFSLEMSAVQLVMRMLCSEARVDMSRVRNGQLSDRDFQRLADTADTRGHRRHAERHGLEDHVGEGLRPRRRDEHVRAPQDGGRVARQAEEAHRVRDAQRAGARLEVAAVVPRAADHQAHRRVGGEERR